MVIKKPLSIFLLFLSLYSGSCMADFGYLASDLREDCREALKAEDNPESKINFPKLGSCYGFITGVDETHDFFVTLIATQRNDSEDIKKYFFYCVEQGVTKGQIARIIVKYLDDHPEKLHQPASFVLLRILMFTFPCENQKNAVGEREGKHE